jgi:hypothetical protein
MVCCVTRKFIVPLVTNDERLTELFWFYFQWIEMVMVGGVDFTLILSDDGHGDREAISVTVGRSTYLATRGAIDS